MELVTCWFCSWNLLHVDFPLRKTYTLNFYPRETDFFMEPIACWFLFVKLVECSFFSSWNLYMDFSPPEADHFPWNLLFADFVLGIFCVPIYFVRETCWILSFLFVKIVNLFFSSWNWFCWWNLLRACFMFVKLVACRFFSSCTVYVDFSTCKTDFAHVTYCLLVLFADTCYMFIRSS